MIASVKLNNQKGFSLVELMVVVAIIGVLAALAVPQVNKYIAKARQSEAKTMLSSIYTSEKAFYAEYSAYHAMFGAIGYSPEGRLRYNAGFAAAGTGADVNNGYTTEALLTAPANTTNSLAYCGATGVILPTIGCTLLNGADSSPPTSLTGSTLSKTAFIAEAAAVVYGTAVDRWRITETKDLTNAEPGIQ